MNRFYFTFGVGTNLGSNYVVVEAATRSEARAIFRAERAPIDLHGGTLYAFDYDEEQFAGQPEKYRLTEVPIYTPIRYRS